jgi:K+-transporting ATPase ATPase C chain
MKKHLVTALLYTAVTAVLLGIVYPLVVTGLAQVLFRDQANGQLIHDKDGALIGSKIIGQPFTGAAYFHSRPSAAGTGYDAGASSGSNLAPTSKALVDRVAASVTTEKTGDAPVPVDLVTTSASGLDPDITPAAAAYQVPRIAAQRHLTQQQVEALVAAHTERRQFGLLGESRVNVLALNLALDATAPAAR